MERFRVGRVPVERGRCTEAAPSREMNVDGGKALLARSRLRWPRLETGGVKA